MARESKEGKDQNQKLLEAFDGDQKLLADFQRFRDKEKQAVIKRELELKTKDLLEDDFQAEHEEAIEGVDKVYRKAWTKACELLEVDEAEFPSRY